MTWAFRMPTGLRCSKSCVSSIPAFPSWSCPRCKTVTASLGRSTSVPLDFIPKSAQRTVMVSALQLVFAGGIYVPPEILRREETPAKQMPRSICDGRPLSPGDLGLTERQMEVLALMLRGKSNKAICRALDLAEPTVKNHVTAVLRALRVTSRAEAIVVVNQLGWKLPAIKT